MADNLIDCKEGLIVWAKIRGFSWWPAKTISFDNAPDYVQSDPPPRNKKHVLVKFFADSNYGFIEADSDFIEPFRCASFKTRINSKKRDVKQAIDEALDAETALTDPEMAKTDPLSGKVKLAVEKPSKPKKSKSENGGADDESEGKDKKVKKKRQKLDEEKDTPPRKRLSQHKEDEEKKDKEEVEDGEKKTTEIKTSDEKEDKTKDSDEGDLKRVKKIKRKRKSEDDDESSKKKKKKAKSDDSEKKSKKKKEEKSDKEKKKSKKGLNGKELKQLVGQMREAVKEKEFSKLLKQLKTVDTYLPQLSIEDIQESKIGKLLPNFAKSEKHKDISQAAKKINRKYTKED